MKLRIKWPLHIIFGFYGAGDMDYTWDEILMPAIFGAFRDKQVHIHKFTLDYEFIEDQEYCSSTYLIYPNQDIVDDLVKQIIENIEKEELNLELSIDLSKSNTTDIFESYYKDVAILERYVKKNLTKRKWRQLRNQTKGMSVLEKHAYLTRFIELQNS